MLVKGEVCATIASFNGKKLAVALFCVRSVTDASRKVNMDVTPDEVECAHGAYTCHAQFMPFSQEGNRYVWNGHLFVSVVTFKGSHVRFLKLKTTEDGMWEIDATQMRNLAEVALADIPHIVPPIKSDPYEGIPFKVDPTQ